METIYTLKREISFKGTGVHTGEPIEVKLVPSEEGKIVFRRKDLEELEFYLEFFSVETAGSTFLEKDGHRIKTVEHLLASLFCLRIISCEVHLNGSEVPILDGSALPFVDFIKKAGRVPLKKKTRTLKITRPFFLQEGDVGVKVEPDSCFRISCLIDFSHPSIRRQEFSLEVNESSFSREIAPARTFGFLKDLSSLQQKGLAIGSSLDNTVALDEEGIINPPLRFPDEFVRHKVLDFIGDLSLLSRPLKGHFQAIRAGHRFHLMTVDFILNHSSYWTWE